MMAYTALRPFKYQAADGQMRFAKPGEAISESAFWRNRDKLIRRGWLSQENGEPFDDRTYKTHAPKSLIEKAKQEKVPELEIVRDQDLSKVLIERQPGPIYTESDLKNMAKIELQVIASDLGLDDTGNKTDLVQAILADQG